MYTWDVEACSESEHWQPNLIRIQISKHSSPALRPHPFGCWELITSRVWLFHYFRFSYSLLLSGFASESAYCSRVLAPLPWFPWFRCLETLCRILQTSSSCAKANLNSQPSETFPSLLTLSWWFACCEVFAGVFWPFLHIHCVTAKWATDAKWKRPKSYIAFPWLVALQSWCEGGLGAAGRKRSGMRMCIWKSRGTVNERWS